MSIEVGKLEEWQGNGGFLGAAVADESHPGGGRLGNARQLLLQRFAIGAEHHTGRRQDQCADIFRHGMPVAQEDSAGFVDTGLDGMSFDQPLQLHAQGSVVTRTLLVEHHQVDAKTAHAPVGVSLKQLSNHVNAAVVGDGDRQNRQVARDAQRP